jgi:putative DNA primase/helicase
MNMMIGIGDQCRNRWHSILPQIGISPQYLTGKQTPCPLCGGRDRFRFDNKEGRGTYFCNACGAGDGVQLVMLATGKPFRDTASCLREIAVGAPEVKPRPSMGEEQRINALRDTWRNSKVITVDDDAGRYLISRGFSSPFSDALRFVPKLKVTGEKVKVLAAMIALVRDPEGNPLNLHRTYLSDGKKADISSPRRMMAGATPHGSYIALSDAAEEMGAAEGIETALAAEKKFGIPCWSLISADGLKAFTPPAIVKRLRVFGDNDPKFGGQAAAYALAHRLSVRLDSIETSVDIPPQMGSDWADAA